LDVSATNVLTGCQRARDGQSFPPPRKKSCFCRITHNARAGIGCISAGFRQHRRAGITTASRRLIAGFSTRPRPVITPLWGAIGNPKSAAGDRTIPMAPIVLIALRE